MKEETYDLNDSHTTTNSSVQLVQPVQPFIFSSIKTNSSHPLVFMSNPTELLLDKSKIFNKVDMHKRKTKIICTLGPATSNLDTLVKMISAGMDVARISTSRVDGIYYEPVELRKLLKDACKKCRHVGLGIMYTTKGPEILAGKIENGEIKLNKGDFLEISTDFNFIGGKFDFGSRISCDYPELCESVYIGGQIVFVGNNDVEGVIEGINCEENLVTVKILDSGVIQEKSVIYLPFADIKIPTITEEDEESLVNFVLKEGVDMIAVSFVRSFQDIEEIRDILGPRGAYIKIIAKIDNYLGIQNYDKILEDADGVMIARGRLCYELPEEKLFQYQKYMIDKAKLAGKPVITSTQMLDSMARNARPTLAEVTDVANAVLDGSDAVLLSTETSTGKYPVESLEMMAKICVEAEQCIYYQKSFEFARTPIFFQKPEKEIPKENINKQEVMCNVAVQTAEDINASLIIVITETGSTARLLAKLRPKQTILALCMSAGVIRQLKITRGVITLKIPSFLGSENLITQSILFSQESGFIQKGDKIVCILGENEETPDYANIMKITTVR